MEAKSLLYAKNKLPLDFTQEIYNTFSSKIADKILTGMYEKRYTTLRVNTIKYNIEDLIAVLKK